MAGLMGENADVVETHRADKRIKQTLIVTILLCRKFPPVCLAIIGFQSKVTPEEMANDADKRKNVCFVGC